MSNHTIWYRASSEFDPGLLILAFLVAVQAAYVSVTILKAHHLRAMVVLGALTFSVGSIFSMHFIAMGAETNVVSMNMNTGWTIASVFFAFIPCAIAMVFLTDSLPSQAEHENTLLGNWQAFKEAPHWQLLLGATVMSIGVASMHYTGAIAIFATGHHKYVIMWIAIVCAYLLIACVIALHCCFVLPLTKQYALPTAVVLSIATTGFHTWAAVLSHYVEVNDSLVEKDPGNMMRDVSPYIVFLSTMLSFIAYYSATHFTRNSNAPTDETKPLTAVFTDIEKSSKLYSKIPEVMQEANEKHHKIMLSQLSKHRGHFVKSIGDAIFAVFKDPLDAVAFMAETQVVLNKTIWDPKIDLMYKKFLMKGGNVRTKNNKETASSAGDKESSISSLKSKNTNNNNDDGMSSSKMTSKTNGTDQNTPGSDSSMGYGDVEGGINIGDHARGLRVRMGGSHGVASIVFDENQKTFDYFSDTINCASRVESAARGGQILISRELLNAAGGEEAIKHKLEVEVESHGLYALRGIKHTTELIEITPESLILRRPFPPPNADRAEDVDFDDSADEFNMFATEAEREALAAKLGQKDQQEGGDQSHLSGNGTSNDCTSNVVNIYNSNNTSGADNYAMSTNPLMNLSFSQSANNNNNNHTSATNNESPLQDVEMEKLAKMNDSGFIDLTSSGGIGGGVGIGNNNHELQRTDIILLPVAYQKRKQSTMMNEHSSNHNNKSQPSVSSAQAFGANNNSFSGGKATSSTTPTAAGNNNLDSSLNSSPSSGGGVNNKIFSGAINNNNNNNKNGAVQIVPSAAPVLLDDQQQQNLGVQKVSGTVSPSDLAALQQRKIAIQNQQEETSYPHRVENGTNENNRDDIKTKAGVDSNYVNKDSEHVDEKQEEAVNFNSQPELPQRVATPSALHQPSGDNNNNNNNNNAQQQQQQAHFDLTIDDGSQQSFEKSDAKVNVIFDFETTSVDGDSKRNTNNNTVNSQQQGNSMNNTFLGGTKASITSQSAYDDYAISGGGGVRQNSQNFQQNHQHPFDIPSPEDVFDFVVQTVHRLVRRHCSVPLVTSRLRTQLDGFEILLSNVKDLFMKRQIVYELARSWGHKNSFPESTSSVIQRLQDQGGFYTVEQKEALENEITCALTILSGRTLSRLLQKERLMGVGGGGNGSRGTINNNNNNKSTSRKYSSVRKSAAGSDSDDENNHDEGDNAMKDRMAAAYASSGKKSIRK